MQPYDYRTNIRSPFESAILAGKAQAAQQEAQAQQQAAQQQAAMRQQLVGLIDNPAATSADYARVLSAFPAQQKEIATAWDARSEGERQSMLTSAGQIYSALNAGANDIATGLISERAQALRNAGREDEARQYDTMGELIRVNPGYAKFTAGLMLASVPGGSDYMDSAAKVGAEARTQEAHPYEMRKAAAEATTAEVEAKYAEREAISALNERQRKAVDDARFSVQTSVPYADGTVQLIGRDGQILVMDPSGRPVPPEEAAKRILAANEYGIETAGRKSRSGELGKVDAKTVQQTLTSLDAVQRSIPLYDEAVAALDRGADTGRIASIFPSMTEATVSLENIQARLGISLLSEVPTGALTEGERASFYATALPLNMSEPALREWLLNRKSATEKVASMLRDRIRFMNSGGSALDWIEYADRKYGNPYSTGAASPASRGFRVRP